MGATGTGPGTRSCRFVPRPPAAAAAVISAMRVSFSRPGQGNRRNDPCPATPAKPPLRIAIPAGDAAGPGENRGGCGRPGTWEDGVRKVISDKWKGQANDGRARKTERFPTRFFHLRVPRSVLRVWAMVIVRGAGQGQGIHGVEAQAGAEFEPDAGGWNDGDRGQGQQQDAGFPARPRSRYQLLSATERTSRGAQSCRSRSTQRVAVAQQEISGFDGMIDRRRQRTQSRPRYRRPAKDSGIEAVGAIDQCQVTLLFRGGPDHAGDQHAGAAARPAAGNLGEIPGLSVQRESSEATPREKRDPSRLFSIVSGTATAAAVDGERTGIAWRCASGDFPFSSARRFTIFSADRDDNENMFR